MAETCAEWLERQADRALARQRAQVDTAKLLATFAVGVAATLIATALQVGPTSRWDRVGTYLLAASFVAVLGVITVDRLTEADHSTIIELSHVHGWTEDRLVTELRAITIAAVNNNASVVRLVRWVVAIQVLLSALSGAAAAMSLLT